MWIQNFIWSFNRGHWRRSKNPDGPSRYTGLSNCLERARPKPAEPRARGKYGPVALPTLTHTHRNRFIDLHSRLRPHARTHTHTLQGKNKNKQNRKLEYTHKNTQPHGEQIEIRENLILSAAYTITHTQKWGGAFVLSYRGGRSATAVSNMHVYAQARDGC